MGFGTDFQGRGSHDALLHIQDTEIKLLENVKVCLQKRIDGDKKYLASLTSMVQNAMKVEETEYHTYCSIFKAWGTLIHSTHQFIELLQLNLDALSSTALEKIQNLISDKKAARKSYEEERNRMEKEFTRIKDQVQKNKQDYTKLVDKVKLEKAKYEELSSKGKGSNKVDSAKQSYVSSSQKLHKLHNKYILSLCELKSHQEHYSNKTLPYFLDHHQANQEILTQQCKDFFDEFQKLTNFASKDHLAVYASIEKAVKDIEPEKEYSGEFTTKYKSEKFSPISIEFDAKILDGYEGTLVANQLALNDFTVDSLTHIKSSLKEDIESQKKCVQDMETEKTSYANQVSESRQKLSLSVSDQCQEDLLGYLNNRKKFEELKKKIAEIESVIATKKDLLILVDDPLKRLGGQSPPAALDLPDITALDTLSTHSGGEPSAKKATSKLFKKIFKKSDKAVVENGQKEDPANYEEQTSRTFVGGDSDIQSASGNQPKKLEDEQWFHGVLPREEVQRLLVNDGDFLVRESKNKRTNETQYVLSAFWQGYKHFIIQFQEGGWRFEGQKYPTIPELVNHQYDSGAPVTSKSGTILSNPICRESWELNNDDILLETKIGNGNFGEVFKGTYRRTDEIVAVKTCKDTLSEDQRKKFLMEGRILKQYDHPNIVKFIGIAAQRQPVMIIMEYVSGGALLSFLRKDGKKQTRLKATQMCVDAACGMAYLTDKGCIHRDLAARNCLVGDNSVVKISDFGMSREEEEYTVSDGMKQIPIKWTAPEALNFGKYTSACDVWSYGILMWEVFSNGMTPYTGWTNAVARDSVQQGYRMPAPPGTPECVHKIMLKCWEENPQTRINFQTLYRELANIVKNPPKEDKWS